MMTIDASIYHQRQNKLKKIMKTAGLDAIVLNPSPSLPYLTGLKFHLSERPVIFIFPVEGHPAIVLPKLELAKLQSVDFPLNSVPYGENPDQWGNSLKQAMNLTKLTHGIIGVEAKWLRVLELNLLTKAAPESLFESQKDTVAILRMYKDETEISAIRKAVHIAQEALRETLPSIVPGASEKEIANKLTMQLLLEGSEPRLPFFPIVSSGPNSANPHAAPSDRKLVDGDLLVIDFGANIENYFSDITRTFAIGKVENEFLEIADIVYSANQAGIAAARPGEPIGNVDLAAREIIENAGYGEFFTHRTGHGLGLEGHEEPYIRGNIKKPLEPGMSFTVEPGIYLPNRGGVRIEDNIIITETGCECLTDFPRKLIHLS